MGWARHLPSNQRIKYFTFLLQFIMGLMQRTFNLNDLNKNNIDLKNDGLKVFLYASVSIVEAPFLCIPLLCVFYLPCCQLFATLFRNMRFEVLTAVSKVWRGDVDMRQPSVLVCITKSLSSSQLPCSSHQDRQVSVNCTVFIIFFLPSTV